MDLMVNSIYLKLWLISKNYQRELFTFKCKCQKKRVTVNELSIYPIKMHKKQQTKLEQRSRKEGGTSMNRNQYNKKRSSNRRDQQNPKSSENTNNLGKPLERRIKKKEKAQNNHFENQL